MLKPVNGGKPLWQGQLMNGKPCWNPSPCVQPRTAAAGKDGAGADGVLPQQDQRICPLLKRLLPLPDMLDNTAYIGLGANLGNALQQVKDAVATLNHIDGIQVDAVSALYRTAPVDSSGDDYINAVARLLTSLDAGSLLDTLLQVEKAFGRERPYANAPRTLDLDLLLFNTEQRHTPHLTLPHPRMHERAFVLVPLVEIAPDLVIPGKGPAVGFIESVADQRILQLKPFCF